MMRDPSALMYAAMSGNSGMGIRLHGMSAILQLEPSTATRKGPVELPYPGTPGSCLNPRRQDGSVAADPELHVPSAITQFESTLRRKREEHLVYGCVSES